MRESGASAAAPLPLAGLLSTWKNEGNENGEHLTDGAGANTAHGVSARAGL